MTDPVPTPVPTPVPVPVPVPTPTPTPTPLPESHYGGIAGQDMALVGSRIWVFSQSDSNHPTKGGWVRDVNSLVLKGYFQQNISHAATVDYLASSDTMVIGNAGDTNSAAPRLDLLTGYSNYGIGKLLDWNDPVGTPRISIPLLVYAADGTTVARSAFPNTARRSASGVWGDNSRTMYVFGGSTSDPLTVLKLTLGTGSDDLSDGANGYGNFIPGKGGTEYNGTARVVATYTSSLVGTTQGAKWHNGKLYLGWTVSSPSQRALEVLELTLGDGNITVSDRYRYFPQGPDGKGINFETQAVMFRGDDLLVSGRRTPDNYQSIYRFTAHDAVVDLIP